MASAISSARTTASQSLSPTLSVTEDTDEEEDEEIALNINFSIASTVSDDGDSFGLSLIDNLLQDQEQYQKTHGNKLSPMAVEEIPKTPRNDEADEEAFGNILFAFTQQESTISDKRRSLMQNGPLIPLKNMTADTLMRCSSAGALPGIDDDEKSISRTLSAGAIHDVTSINIDTKDILDFDDDLEDDDDDVILGVNNEKKIAMDPVQHELMFERTTQSMMISCGDSDEGFKALSKICNNLKKDDLMPYSVSFDAELLKYEHTDSFLKLLGFKQNASDKQWICDAKSRVDKQLLRYAALQCHKSLILIHQHQSIKDLIFERRVRSGSASNKRKSIKKRLSSSKEKNKRKSASRSTRKSEKKKSLKFETLIEEDEKEEFDGDEDDEMDVDDEDDEEYEDSDYLQLYELIWSITHQNSTDHTAEDVLILCYPLVTTAKSIMQCLEARFFGDDDAGLIPATSPKVTPHSSESSRVFFDRVLSSFGVQEKVIEFIQFWIENYWHKDWKFAPKLILRAEEFMERIQNAYESDESIKIRYDKEEVKKALKLVSQTDKLISNQQRRQTIILNKLFGDNNNNNKCKSLLDNNNKKRTFKMSIGTKYKMPNFKKELQIMNMSHIILAEQITLQTFMIYKSIHPRECLNQSWKDKKNKNIVAQNITRYINAFNRLTKWIQTGILGAENVKKRGKTIKKWVKIEEELYKLRNFQGLCAVYSALASCAIYKLKDAWNYVAKKHMTQHDMITVVMRSTGNWKNLRRLQLEAHPPMIPYFGMFAQDLIAIEETTSNRSNDGNINWNALRKVNTVIEKYLIYHNTPYVNLSANAIIQRWMNKELDKTDKVDPEWMFQISTHVKQKDIEEIRSKTKNGKHKSKKSS